MASSPSALPQSAQAAELQELAQVIRDTYVNTICTTAAAAWLAYDILLTFQQEIYLIWRARWTLPKCLYIIVRYYTLVALLVNVAVNTNHGISVCQKWVWFNGFNGALASGIFGEILFVMRLYAAYQRTIPILVTIICLSLTVVLSAIVTAAIAVPTLKALPYPPELRLPGCLVTAPEHLNLLIMVWAMEMSVTFIYFVLIMYKFARNLCIRRREEAHNAVEIGELRRISPVVFSFLRDSAFYFLCFMADSYRVFFGNLMNLIFDFVFTGRALILMSTVWLGVIYALSASRLCLNTRDSVHRTEVGWETTWYNEYEYDDRVSAAGTSAIQFASPSAIVSNSSGSGSEAAAALSAESTSEEKTQPGAWLSQIWVVSDGEKGDERGYAATDSNV